ncbi:MAG: AAA family ATPase, partial [Nitrososphaerota archaeon]|nr:AAA family ATPase [Nitrososphaerota archaeon]
MRAILGEGVSPPPSSAAIERIIGGFLFSGRMIYAGGESAVEARAVSDPSRTTEEASGEDGGAEALSMAEIAARVMKRARALYKEPLNLEVLRESYVPAKLTHRHDEQAAVIRVLSPSLHGGLPSNLTIYGKAGTGKTAVATIARRYLDEAGKGVSSVYVNCAIANTEHAMLRDIANQLRPADQKAFGEKRGTSAANDAILEGCELRGGIVLMFLDEADKVAKASGPQCLYSLSEINKRLKKARVGLVMISNDVGFVESLDTPTRSRLNPEKLVFPPYNAKQLEQILKDRARQALQPNALEEGVIPLIATWAAQLNGDARKAVGLLRVAVQIAEETGANRVTHRHAEQAKSRLEEQVTGDQCRALPVHDKVVMWALAFEVYPRDVPSVLSAELHKAYRRSANAVKLSLRKEIEKTCKIIFRFPRKADNKRRANRQIEADIA